MAEGDWGGGRATWVNELGPGTSRWGLRDGIYEAD